jgi:hypothetical protein
MLVCRCTDWAGVRPLAVLRDGSSASWVRVECLFPYPAISSSSSSPISVFPRSISFPFPFLFHATASHLPHPPSSEPPHSPALLPVDPPVARWPCPQPASGHYEGYQVEMQGQSCRSPVSECSHLVGWARPRRNESDGLVNDGDASRDQFSRCRGLGR